MKKLILVGILTLTFSTAIFACGQGNDSSRGEGSFDPAVETSVEVQGESIIIE